MREKRARGLGREAEGRERKGIRPAHFSDASAAYVFTLSEIQHSYAGKIGEICITDVHDIWQNRSMS